MLILELDVHAGVPKRGVTRRLDTSAAKQKSVMTSARKKRGDINASGEQKRKGEFVQSETCPRGETRTTGLGFGGCVDVTVPRWQPWILIIFHFFAAGTHARERPRDDSVLIRNCSYRGSNNDTKIDGFCDQREGSSCASSPARANHRCTRAHSDANAGKLGQPRDLCIRGAPQYRRRETLFLKGPDPLVPSIVNGRRQTYSACMLPRSCKNGRRPLFLVFGSAVARCEQ